jgi:hypothetical protein
MRLAGLEETPPALAACTIPRLPAEDYPVVDGRPLMSAMSRAYADILAMALACDQTRIFTNMFSSAVSNILFADPWPPRARDGHPWRSTGKYGRFRASMGHHRLTHDEPGDQPEVNIIVKLIMEEFAYFLGRLAAVPEGDGTLLDHSGILATTDCSNCRTHSLDDYPLVLAGGANGNLKTNIHYRSPSSENTSKAVFSLLRAVGVRITEFGRDGGRVTEGLPAIESDAMS